MISFCSSERPWFRQGGQTFLVIVVFIAVFLLAVLGLATDYSQVWAHRQMAQGAADAACQAAAADLFLNAIDPSASGQNGLQSFSWIGSPFNCSANASSPPCAYAALNGYSASNVSVTFPSSLAGVSTIPAGFGTIAHPYVEVTITDHVPMSFTKLVSSTGTVNITASAGCGLNPVAVPIPLVVLHHTAIGALSTNGGPIVQIIGGPKRAVQVNSVSSTAVSLSTNSTINLSQAGPSGSGADFAVFGGPTTKPGNVNLGTSGSWISPATPFDDPWATVSAPSRPGGTDWLPNHSYAAGTLVLPSAHNAGNFVYQVLTAGTSGGTAPNPWNQTVCARQPTGTCSGGNQADNTVTWQNIGKVTTTPNTAIFDPGLYYVGTNGLKLASSSTVRMSTAAGDGKDGATFYFTLGGTDTLAVDSNSGSSSPCTSASAATGSGSPSNCIVSYNINGTVSSAATGYVVSRQLRCPAPGSPPNPAQITDPILNGNIMLGPCSGTFGDPTGQNRGFLFFQNRSQAASPSWGGGGGFILSGFMYFHSASYGTTLSLSGGSSSNSFALGNIVVDELSLGGNSGIKMILNPQVTFQVLRPQLLQ